MKVKSKYLAIGISLLTLSACGESTSHIDTSQDTYTGVFLDSAVEGLQYQTDTQEGFTDSDGQFTYLLGESITFSVGDLTFPTTEAQTTITPLNIFNTEEVEDSSVLNMLRLLQTLDSDGLPDNGITILPEAHTLLDGVILDFSDENFESTINNALVSYSGVNTSLISEDDALFHFNETISLKPPFNDSACSSNHILVGSQAEFQTYSHGTSGTATIIDDCTIEVTNFSYDSAAPAVYFYADTSSNFASGSAFIIGDQLRDNGDEYENEKITLTLPSNRTLDDIEYLSVWCVDFSVNFADLNFEQPISFQRFSL